MVLLPAGGVMPLQEGQTGGVNVHGDGAGISGLYQVHLLPDGFQIPGLHSGNTAAAVGFQGIRSAFHDGGVGAVTGEGEDTGFGAALHQYIVIAQVVIFVAVMHSHGTNGAGHYGRSSACGRKNHTEVSTSPFSQMVSILTHSSCHFW